MFLNGFHTTRNVVFLRNVSNILLKGVDQNPTMCTTDWHIQCESVSNLTLELRPENNSQIEVFNLTAFRSNSAQGGGAIVSAHRRILGMATVVCVLVKICVSSITLYKIDTDKLTTPFESAHQFILVCTVSDSKTVPGCHYNLCSNHSFVLTD